MGSGEKNCISIHLGQAGLQIAHATWELLAAEHAINPDGTLQDNTTVDKDDTTFRTFFQETPAGQYVPRALLVDLEPTVMDEIRTGPYKHLFHPELMVNTMEDSGSNFARARITVGQHILPILSDKIRLIAETCDTIQGFLIFNSFGGGTGSGLGSYLAEKLSHEFSRRCRINVGVFPGKTTGGSCVEPYNATLFSQSIVKDYDLSVLMDNDSLYDICKRNLCIDRPTFVDINRIAAQVVSSLTSNLRFEGQMNGTMEEMKVNLIPYPTLLFPITAFAPILSPDRINHSTLSTMQLIRSTFNRDHRLMSVSLEDHAYMAACMYFRGEFSPSIINQSITAIKSEDEFKWVDWCPTGFKFGINSQPPTLIPGSNLGINSKAILLLANSGAMSTAFRRMRTHAEVMLRKKAFYHWYEREGLEVDEMRSAIDDVSIIEIDYYEASKVCSEANLTKKENDSPEESQMEHNYPVPVGRKVARTKEIEPDSELSPTWFDDSVDIKRAGAAKVAPKKCLIGNHLLVQGSINHVCDECAALLRGMPDAVTQMEYGNIPSTYLCRTCLDGLSVYNKKDLCNPCNSLVQEKFNRTNKYNAIKVTDLCDHDQSKFLFHAIRTVRNVRSIVMHPFMRMADLCEKCRPMVNNDHDAMYVCGCISIETLCRPCELAHKRELEVQARKGIVATDLCDRCKKQTHSVQPKLCKVWGAIEMEQLCTSCINNHEVDPENDMIDPGSLCDSCRLKIDSVSPTSYPVKGSITSEKVCNDCKKRGRITSKDCGIDPKYLCHRCKMEVGHEVPKTYQLKGSFDIHKVCENCQNTIAKKSKMNIDDLCKECKTVVTGKGREITVRGYIDVKMICNPCLSKIKSRPDGGSGVTIPIDAICNQCKTHMRGRKDEINIRGGINPAHLCASCERKVFQPFTSEIISKLCDECVQTIPKAGAIDERYLCGLCAKALKEGSLNNNYNHSRLLKPFKKSPAWMKDFGTGNNNTITKIISRTVSSPIKWLNIGLHLGDVDKSGFKPVLRPVHNIVDMLIRCNECTFKTGLSFKEGLIKGGPSDFCDNCLLKIGIPNEFLVLCKFCRVDSIKSYNRFDLESRPMSNKCISCKSGIPINFETLKEILQGSKLKYGEKASSTAVPYGETKPRKLKRSRFFTKHVKNENCKQANCNNIIDRRSKFWFFKNKKENPVYDLSKLEPNKN